MGLRRTFTKFGIALVVGAVSVVAGLGEAPAVLANGLPIRSVVPARLADTRPGAKTIDGQFAAMGRRGTRSWTEIRIAGRGNVPADATAVLLNLTDVQLDDGYGRLNDNFLTVYPCTSAVPTASNLNTPGGDIRANNVFVKLSGTGTVCVYTERMSHFIIDVNGYVPAGGSTASVTPARLFDSRPGQQTVDGMFSGGGELAPGSRTEIKIAGRGGVPTDASGVMINVTDVLPKAGNYLSVYPCTTERPDSSSVNTPPWDIRANNVYVALSPSGTVCVYTVSATNLVVDVNGYVPASGTPFLVQPARLFDSRPGAKTVDGRYNGAGPVGAGSTTEVQIAGRGHIGTDATEAVINLTSVLPAGGTYLTVYPCDSARPDTSNLNLPANDIRANSVFVKLSAAGTVCIYTVSATNLVIDVNAYSVSTPVPLRVTNYRDEINTSVDYEDFSLDGKATWQTAVAPTGTAITPSVLGGTPPYTFTASGLNGYGIDKDHGSLIRVDALPGRQAFTLTVTDATGTKLSLPATIIWKPTMSAVFDYRAFLPNGQTVEGPKIVNWGKPPYTYAWTGPSGAKLNSSTGEVTYSTSYSPNSGQLDTLASMTVTDQTGARLPVETILYAQYRWTVSVLTPAVGSSLGQFETNGWGNGPYSYTLAGELASKFGISSTGQLTFTDPAYVSELKAQVNLVGSVDIKLSATVTDAAGNKLTVPVTVKVGLPFTR